MRKKAEEDAQLLSNRIALLQIEEKKALKKIEETRKKAKEIMDLKVRNAEMQRQKEEARKQKEEEEMIKSMQNKMMKEQIKQNQTNTKNGLMQKLKGDVDQMRKTKRDSKEMNYMNKDETHLKNQQTMYAIKTQHQDLKTMKSKKLEDTKQQARIEYERKIDKEMLIKEQTEAKIAKLEQMEMELIQRLQNTQSIQKEAFDDLEKVISANPAIDNSK